jgi:hypothetical protein
MLTGFVPCWGECDPQTAKGEACVVEVFAVGPNCPPPGCLEGIEGWWIVRSLSDGRRYYVYDGAYGVGVSRKEFTLCDVRLGYDLEGFGWHEYYMNVPEYHVEAENLWSECTDCREPTPAPRLPFSQHWPAKCNEPRHFPLVSK